MSTHAVAPQGQDQDRATESPDGAPARIAPAQALAHPWLRAAAWVACLLSLYGMAVAAHYPLRDPDSTLYESISAQLVDRPVEQWIAPLFPPHRFKEGLFLEHLAAFFWPAAALGRLGFSRGALLANFIYFLGLLYLLFRLARAVADREAAWLAVGLFVISPLGIQYLIRANHENAWGLAFLGGFWCLHELGRGRRYGLGFALFGLLAFAVKGALALVYFPVMLAWWGMTSRRAAALAWFALCAALIAAFAAAYELAFQKVTGQSFFAGYLGTQLGYVARDEHRAVWAKLVNVGYYLANLAWCALPGSLAAGWGLWRAWRGRARTSGAQRLLITGGLGTMALLSLMTRRAARYIFPAYPVAVLAGAEVLLGRSPRLRAWLSRRSVQLPYLLMAALLVILPLRMAFDLHFYHFINPLR